MGIFGRAPMFAQGLVATPEQEAWTNQMGTMFPNAGRPLDTGAINTAQPIDTGAGQAKPRTGFFGQGGIGRTLAGAIGDWLAQVNGVQPVYAPTIAARQQAQLRQQAQADENAQWFQRERWKRQNPEPINNDTANDYAFWQQHLTPEQFDQWKQRQYDPVVSVPLPNGSMYMGPRSGMGAAVGGAPQGAGNDWDSATPYNGGPTPPASGNFHIPSGNPLDPWPPRGR